MNNSEQVYLKLREKYPKAAIPVSFPLYLEKGVFAWISEYQGEMSFLRGIWAIAKMAYWVDVVRKEKVS